MAIDCRLYVLIFCSTLWGSTSSSSKKYFTGAVYEHNRQRDGFENEVKTNLEYYQKAAALAKQQGADLIVYPEYGIFPPDEREKNKKFLEYIPNPKNGLIVPCNESSSKKSPILYALSCIAQEYRIVVVANMGGIESCLGDYDCSDDGDRHLNANVAFDKNGTLIGRYYKERLFFESGMDLPKEKQNPIFKTEIGKFGMFTSFDIIFKKMAEVSRLEDIDAILFPCMWVNSSPFYTSTQWFQAWAMGNNATLLAANIQMPGYLAAGGGIYRGRKGALASTLNPDGKPKLIVSTIPKFNEDIMPISKITTISINATEQLTNDGKDMPWMCSFDILGKHEDIEKDYRCINENVSNYTLVKLHKSSDHLEICHNGLCCVLDYIVHNMTETFYLGVFKGIHNSFNRYFWFEENCFLARCEEYNGTNCVIFPMTSQTIFHKIVMKANIRSKYIYPSLARSHMRLVPATEWTYGFTQNKPTIEFNSNSGIPILVVTLKGRIYAKDPPYIR